MPASTKKAKKTAPKKTKKVNKKGEVTKQTLAKAAKKAAQKEIPTSVVFTDEEMAPLQNIDKDLVTLRLNLSKALEFYRKQETAFLDELAIKSEEATKLSDKLVRGRIGDALDEYKWHLNFGTNTLSRQPE